MCKITTTQRILDESLSLFSKKGYHSVSVEEIAKAVGIKAPSLYKHYKSKKHIFDAIFSEMKELYAQHMEQIFMNGISPEVDSQMFGDMSEAQLLQIGYFLFSYFLHNNYNQKIRKMLVIEQFSNKEVTSIYSSEYFDKPIQFQETIFLSLINLGKFKKSNPKIMAIHFYAPIHHLIALCDRQPEREKEALVLLENHIKQFNQIYKMEDN